jgi:16S rRNA (cytosine967-C5)-methyltransferase
MHEIIHQNIAQNLIKAYHGQEPFANYLKKYFSANKKHGSRDRKSITALCYDFYRTHFKEFPLAHKIATPIKKDLFIASHQKQPLLFARIRPWQKSKVIQKLKETHFPYKEIGEMGLSFANTTALQTVLEINKEVVIQDLSSQAIARLLKLVPTNMDKVLNVWDACAASGGKTILMFDELNNIKIHVSDVRASILHNCEQRLADAGIRPASIQVIDLTQSFEIKKQFDFVFADVPCSGSGTWGRTPEQLIYFKEEQLVHYTSLQNQIIQNLISTVTLQGYLLYATCSVYEDENEKQVATLLATGKFKLIEQHYFIGYTQQADTLFGALLQKINE